MKKKKATTRGRPALPEGTARSVMLQLKVTPGEAAFIDSIAARHGVSRSEIFRRAVTILSMFPNLMPPEPEPHFTNDPRKKALSLDDLLPPSMRKKEPGK
jgi:hypothetical protein